MWITHVLRFGRLLAIGTLSMISSHAAVSPKYDLRFVNQLLELAEPGATEVALDDMLYRVADLEALRDELLSTGSSGRAARASVQRSVDLWPAGRVPYRFDANVNDYRRQLFREAAAEWETVADVDFVPALPSDQDFVLVQDSDQNSSFIGMVGGSQTINISDWNSKFLIAHELAHALGVSHEQSRSDRDTYVRINTENIQAGKEHNFTIRNTSNLTPYDFESIMHYSRTGFSSNGLPTIEPQSGYEVAAQNMGNLRYLSRYDVESMAALYADTSPLRLVSTAVTDLPAKGEADGTIQPGETINVVLTVRNADSAPIESSSATLESENPNVVVTVPNSQFPAAASGAVVSAAALQFQVASTASLDEELKFSVLLKSLDGRFSRISFSLNTTAPIIRRPAAPKSLKVRVKSKGSSSILDIKFRDVSDNEDRFVIQISKKSTGSWSGWYGIKKLNAGKKNKIRIRHKVRPLTRYRIRVAAENEGGRAFSRKKTVFAR